MVLNAIPFFMGAQVNKKNLTDKVVTFLEFAAQQPAGFVYRSENCIRSHACVPQTTVLTQNTTKKQQLEALFAPFVACTQCPLGLQGRRQVVFGHGNPDAQLMFVGEGPGRDEDAQGLPFVGRAGQLLTKIIEAIDLTRNDVYISNVVKCRPPNNRTPLPDESKTCKQLILLKEIAIIQPTIICALGATAVQALLGENVTITKARGVFHTLGTIPVMPTYHPAYLLRNPDAKRVVWEDMKKIRDRLNAL